MLSKLHSSSLAAAFFAVSAFVIQNLFSQVGISTVLSGCIFFIMAYAAALLFGYPLLLLYKKLNLNRYAWLAIYAAVWLVAMALLFVVIHFITKGTLRPPPGASLPDFALAGIAASIGAWYVAIYGEDDSIFLNTTLRKILHALGIVALSLSFIPTSIIIIKSKAFECYVRGPSSHFKNMDRNNDLQISFNEWMRYYGRHQHDSWQQCGGRQWGFSDFDKNGTISWYEYWGCNQDPKKAAEHRKQWKALEHKPIYDETTKTWKPRNLLESRASSQ